MVQQSRQYHSIQDALTAANQLVKRSKEHDIQLLAVDVGEHIYPGDVYDAYATLQDAGNENRFGPVAAVLIHRYEELNESNWAEGIQRFNHQYVRGFEDGFTLIVPAAVDANDDFHYLRGVYDGVMAHATVF